MPANLPPKYFETEKKLKSATTPEEKISILEELLSTVPKHKGTEKIQANLKTKIAKLKSAAQKRPTTARYSPSHKIKKSGAGQVVITGPPNSGKSLLIKSLTDTTLQVGDYPFTTHEAYPAMMKFENIQIQLVDTPPITADYMEVWFPDLIKTADGVILLIDPSGRDSIDMFHAILDKLREKKIEFIVQDRAPILEIGWSYKKTLMVANKSDLPDAVENLDIIKELMESDFEWISVSAYTGDGLQELKKKIFSMLNIIRIYSKIPGKKVNLNDPFTLEKGSTVLDMARAVHKDFTQKLRFARIWSKTKYDGQRVNRNHIIEDEDIIELHI